MVIRPPDRQRETTDSSNYQIMEDDGRRLPRRSLLWIQAAPRLKVVRFSSVVH